jgi:hypothetical protein
MEVQTNPYSGVQGNRSGHHNMELKRRRRVIGRHEQYEELNNHLFQFTLYMIRHTS